MPPAWRVEQIKSSKSASEFFKNHMLSKAGKYVPLQAARYAVNMLMISKHGTLEFRHFTGTVDPSEARTIAEYMREFCHAALNSGEGMDAIFARMPGWDFPGEFFADGALEAGYIKTTRKYDRSTPKFIMVGEKIGIGSASRRYKGEA
jgi:hypothetical protein